MAFCNFVVVLEASIPIDDTFEIVNELDSTSMTKKRTRRKDKVTTVFRDTHALRNLPTFNGMQFVVYVLLLMLLRTYVYLHF